MFILFHLQWLKINIQEIEQMCNWSEYRLRQGREMGIQEGMQKGIQKGEKRGIEETIKVITLMQQGKQCRRNH